LDQGRKAARESQGFSIHPILSAMGGKVVPKFPKFHDFLLKNEQNNDNFATWPPQN
jgi:hypothetical protein